VRHLASLLSPLLYYKKQFTGFLLTKNVMMMQMSLARAIRRTTPPRSQPQRPRLQKRHLRQLLPPSLSQSMQPQRRRRRRVPVRLKLPRQQVTILRLLPRRQDRLPPKALDQAPIHRGYQSSQNCCTQQARRAPPLPPCSSVWFLPMFRPCLCKPP
uniref:Uncharacterized protein n=2 Tax=Aegilops tauschii subsp. strangulata TaxID=200361 RepID=A0A453H063_AEGTS